jgi:hypothetical protein
MSSLIYKTPERIESWTQLNQRLKILSESTTEPDTTFVVRGQTRHWPFLISSVGRHTQGNREWSGALQYRFATPWWRQATEAIGCRILRGRHLHPEFRWIFGSAALQHYGHPSTFVDVTWSLHTALFFAYHQYHDAFPLLEGVRGPFRVTRPVWYQSTTQASVYIYAIRAPIWRGDRPVAHGDIIDLRPYILGAEGHTRIARQLAMAIYSDLRMPNAGDVSDQVVGCYELPNPMFKFPNLEGMKEAWNHLFPGPEEDDILR